MTYKIAHFASYHINAGDNITITNVRNSLNTLRADISWSEINILDFLDRRNDLEFCIKSFKKISEDFDMLLLGGGGLIEANKNTGTGHKLPLNKEVMEHINIPIVLYGVGVNYFRNKPKFDEQDILVLNDVLQGATLVSVRNDGSLESLQEIGLASKIIEIPDPGLLCSNPKGRIEKVREGFLQPAWNTGQAILDGRSLTRENISMISSIMSTSNISRLIPHSIKDYNLASRLGKFCIYDIQGYKEQVSFNRYQEIFEDYRKYDYIVAMRGHGQLVSIGMNIPGIYFSTQDKLLSFSKKNGFMDYTVDIEEKDWANNLTKKIERLKSDKEYLEEWYKIRDRNMTEYERQNTNFAKKVRDLMK